MTSLSRCRSPPGKGFMRLNSLGEESLGHPAHHNMKHSTTEPIIANPSPKSQERIGQSFHHKFSPQESKWFSPHSSTPQSKMSSAHRNSWHPHGSGVMGVQMPYNVNTGQYECWPSVEVCPNPMQLPSFQQTTTHVAAGIHVLASPIHPAETQDFYSSLPVRPSINYF